MTTRSILCAYNGRDTAVESLAYAIKVAKHHECWLTGIVRHGKPILEARFSAHLPKDAIAAIKQTDTELLESISKRFAKEVNAAGLSGRSEFLEIPDNEDLALGALARAYDLVVTGIPTDDISVAHLAAHPDAVALHSGRPVLVVPDTGAHEGLASHALVAWDGGRSAARALGDAMSILEEQSKVTVLFVGSKAPKGTTYLMKNLKRRGINVDLIVKPRQETIAQTIANTAKEVEAQLIVMGAYEHSKFSHDMFGGPTTDVMRQATVPVFLSH